MDNIYYVYQLKIEGEDTPFYVGKGHKKRAHKHFTQAILNDDSHKSNKINKAYREGKQVLIEFIKKDLIESDAFLWENFWIAEYGRADLGFGPLINKTDGGEGISGKVFSEESKRKIGDAQRGRKMSEEHKRAISDSVSKYKKYNPWNHTEESKRKLSEAHAGKILSDEHKNSLSKDWIVIYPDGTEEKVKNLQKFCDAFGLDASSMRRVAAGKGKQHKGYRCLRAD